jgi:asparagine synthase (glutamine-hydrolysing)
MCGIAGIVPLDGQPPDAALLARMIATLRHRGPDATAYVCDPGAGLAHSRLAIIDPAGGAQPMLNAAGTLVLTFNGEIFNYVELRDELSARGRRFHTASDTEVILHLYEAEGDACVQRLNGQFAFALWDRRRKRLLLARDRLGIRPLFHTVAGGALLFASEIKALLAHPGVSRRIDVAALDQTFTFWSPLAPRTMFADIQSLPPAHVLTVQGSSKAVRRYWQLDYAAVAGDRRDDDYVGRTRELLADATRIQLRADVPVAAYLSGGLDSTIVAALARRIAGRRLQTFSLTFDDAELDERAHQQAVAEFLDVHHTPIHCTTADVGRVFPEVIRHVETPLLRTGPAPLYLLSKHVREAGFTVALTGEGADELFGGYDLFKELKIRQFCAVDPHSRWRSRLFARLYPYLPRVQNSSDAWRVAFFDASSPAESDLLWSHRPRWRAAAKLARFFSDDVRSALADWDPFAAVHQALPSDFQSWDAFSRASYLEAVQLLPGYILASQGDRVSLAHGVETRFPFLDARVVDFAASLPATLKMRRLVEKYVLKRAAAGLAPASVIARTKQPYRSPGLRSFFGPGAPAYVEELLSEREIARHGLFRPSAVAALVRKCRTAAALGNSDEMALVGILSTQLFSHTFIHHAS